MYRCASSPLAGLMDLSADRARRAGLSWTDPGQTLLDVRASGPTCSPLLSPEREADLVAQALALRQSPSVVSPWASR